MKHFPIRHLCASLQSVLITLMSAKGRYSVAGNATPLDAPCSPGLEGLPTP